MILTEEAGQCVHGVSTKVIRRERRINRQRIFLASHPIEEFDEYFLKKMPCPYLKDFLQGE